MFARTITVLASLFLLSVSLVSAANVPEKRQIFNSLTSDVASAFSVATSGAASAFSDATSFGGSVASDATSLAESVATIITSAGGHAATIITEKGGQAFTVATGDAGFLTTVAGSVYRVATSEATASAALGTLPPMTQVFASLAAVLTGMYLGARMIL
ncbi:hypothetical protein BDW22DRAFT_1350583, partial [Trametopsis cervina]